MTLSVSFDVWAYRRYVMALFSSRTMHKRETQRFCTYILLSARRVKQIMLWDFNLTSRLNDGKPALDIAGRFRAQKLKFYSRFILVILVF